MRLSIKRKDGTYGEYDFLDWTLFREMRFGVYAQSERRGKKTYLSNVFLTFDIETSNVYDGYRDYDGNIVGKRPYGFMYIWMCCVCVNDDYFVFYGRTWDEFIEFCNDIQQEFNTGISKFIVCYVHNLSFEFQFMCKFFNWVNIFARQARRPMKAACDIGIEFRCSYFLSNMSLDKFTSTDSACTIEKQTGTYNYDVYRTSDTVLNSTELNYCFADVYSLAEVIHHKMDEYSLANMPLTSTGFVRNIMREAVLASFKNRELVRNLALSSKLYLLLKEMSRGGNTHACPQYSGKILNNLLSMDKKSSYPASMMYDKFPMTAFYPVRVDIDNQPFNLIENGENACALIALFVNIEVKTTFSIPYIPYSRCKSARNARLDNGRIISAECIIMAMTDIDYRIITETYDYDDCAIVELYCSSYGLLPYEFRAALYDMFVTKCELEGGDKYLYDKFKNKINACFGMMMTDITMPEIEYVQSLNDSRKGPWKENKIIKDIHKVEQALNKYYSNPKSFLSYQHGVWVTANARKRLQDGINIVGEDIVYVDTDSVKYIDNHDFIELNNRIIKECESVDPPAFYRKGDKTWYLGLWEKDAEYEEFKTLGAKRYCFKKKGKKDYEITISGVSKEGGARYLNSHGGISAFDEGFVFPASDTYIDKEGNEVRYSPSGRLTSYYNDEGDSPNVALVPTDYCLQLGEDYREFLMELE